jgi:predicted neuraminidase
MNFRKLAITCCLPAIIASARTPSSRQASRDPALAAPVVQTAIDARHADDRRTFQGIPSIERTINKRLWAAWFGRSGSDETDSYVLVGTSDDDGSSWSQPRLVIDPPGAVCAFDPCLWLDPDGMLWLFWAQSYGRWDGRGGVWCITSEDSQSNAPTWSEPRRLCDGVMLNKPTVLKSGDRLLPVSAWAKPADPRTPARYRHEPGESGGANVITLSRNGALALSATGQVRVPQRKYDEHQIIERKDGSLWMLVRAANGIAESQSTDGGKTWTEAKRSPIPHVNSRFCIRRLRSGRLLLITHEPPDGKTRSHLIAHLSEDDGLTWRGGLILDERPGVSYPDAIEGPKGVIRVIYDYARTQAKQILMAQFTENNVLSARPARNTKLRMLVNQATGVASTKMKRSN